MSDEHRPDEPPRRSRGVRIARAIGWTLLGLVLFVAIAICAGAWLLGREATLQRIVAEVQQRMGDQLTVDGVRGSLYDHVAFDRLVFRTKTQVITAEAGDVTYRLEPFERRFTIVTLNAKRLAIETIAKSDEPTVEPDTLEIPAEARLDTLRIDDLRVGAVDLIADGKTTTLTDAHLKGRYATEGGAKRWIVDDVAIATPWGRASGKAALGATKPFALAAELVAEGRVADVPYRAPLTIDGVLADLSLASDFVVSDPAAQPVPGHAEARVMPFREQPVEHAVLHVSGVSPQRWKAGLPDADLTVDARVTPLDASADRGPNPFRGTVRIVNARSGPVDADRIPVAAFDARVSGDARRIALDDLVADLGKAGRVKGKGSYVVDGGVAAFDGRVDDLDLRVVHGKLIATKFDGPLAAGYDGKVARIDTDLADAGRKVRLRGEYEGTEARIAEARVVVGGSRVAASGKIDIAGNRPFAVEGDLAHLDPRDFGDFPKADVTAAFRVSGTLGAEPKGREPQVVSVDADLKIEPSRVMTHAVAGTASGAVVVALNPGQPPVTLRSVSKAKVALAFGANRVNANGAFGRPGDRLAWDVDAPRLVDIGYGLGGVLKGSGTLGGTLAQPSVEFDLSGDQLRYAQNATTAYAVKAIRARGTLLAGEQGTVDADVVLTDFRDGAGPPLLQNAEAHVKGTRQAHTATLTAKSDRFDITTAAHGGLDAKNVWRGIVDELSSRGRLPFSIEGGAPVTAGAERVEVGTTRLNFNEGRVDLRQLVYENGELQTTGSATGFPLALVGTFSRDFARQVATSLKFGAEWDLRAGEAINGRVRLFRESGNIQFLTEPRFAVDPSKVEVSADIVANKVRARIEALGTGLGQIQASVDTELSKRDGQWGLSGDAPLALKSDVDIPDLRWLARLSGRPGLDLFGRLQVAVTGRGTVGRPLLSGQAHGDGIGVRWPDQGMNFKDGTLDVNFEGDRIVLKEAVLSAGKGKVTTNGELRLGDKQMNGTLAVKLDRFEAVSRTDRTVVVSGTGNARFGAAGINVTADLKADRGSLQLAERRGPTMSDDIVIVGREKDEDEVPAKSVPVRFEVKFDMGDDFKVKGSGFDGKLGGVIRIAGNGTDLQAIGTVNVREGVYVAYGQTLTITRGNLTFSGPIDNPALDILAVRKNLAVEPGVQVTGTALAPQARLVSNPSVPDTEKLSWLILGHGLSSTSKSDLGLLTTAAASLLGSSDSAGIQSRIAATLGVDEIGVSGLGGDQGGLLRVGKQISSRLRVSFEQGFTKAATLLKVRYNIYRQVDLQVQTGTDNAVDVFYTFRFD